MKCGKVHIFWEGHKTLRNLHPTFDWHYIGQKVEISQSFVTFSEYMNFTYLENITLVVFRKVSTRPALIHHQGFLGSTKEDKWCLKNQPPIGIFKSFMKERMLSIRDPTFQFLELKIRRVWNTIYVLQLKFMYSNIFLEGH